MEKFAIQVFSICCLLGIRQIAPTSFHSKFFGKHKTKKPFTFGDSFKKTFVRNLHQQSIEVLALK